MPHPALAALIDAVPAIAVTLIGLAMAAAALFLVVDANKQFRLGKDREP